MRLILVRHGETEHNRERRAQGHVDAPLNDLGVRQAAACEFALAEEKIAAVYASPRRRTIDTARAIASPHDVEVIVEERIVEMDVGEFDGMPLADLRERYPEFLAKWVGPEGPFIPMPGGSESLTEVQARARSGIEEIIARHPDETVVVVSHNFVITTLLCWMLGMALTDFRRLRIGVASMSRFEVVEGRAQVITLNDTCHLRGLE